MIPVAGIKYLIFETFHKPLRKMNSLTFFIILAFINDYFGANATLESLDHGNCQGASSVHVGRIRDIADCRHFYHCIPGKDPVRQECPHQEYSQGRYQLYYNPNTTSCDYSNKVCEIHPECCERGARRVVDLTEIETGLTISSRSGRPPLLSDDEFQINCDQEQCGLFPNAWGPCNTYVVCADGERLTKNCNDGQLFDVRTLECRPADEAQCWQERRAPPHSYRRGEQCPFHGNQPTPPIESRADSVILQNPVVTNWGTWQRWTECPRGTYATGLYAWRRVLSSTRRGADHMGIFSLSFRCQSAGGNETNRFIESFPPGATPHNWPRYYMCTGAVIGFRLNSVRAGGFVGTRGRDEIATDNIVGFCSCSDPVFKPYDDPIYAPQNGHRGRWTTSQYCRKYQAVCGMQTQMHQYRERAIGTHDNNGLNNIKIKCCDVPSPLDNCRAVEDRVHVRDCDNRNSDQGLRCDFQSMVGLTMDYVNRQKVLNWYSSVGYDIPVMRDQMREKIIGKLGEEIEAGATREYTWEEPVPPVQEDEEITPRAIFVGGRQRVQLYQIVGRCDYLMVRSNRYVRVVRNASGGVISESYFEV